MASMPHAKPTTLQRSPGLSAGDRLVGEMGRNCKMLALQRSPGLSAGDRRPQARCLTLPSTCFNGAPAFQPGIACSWRPWWTA